MTCAFESSLQRFKPPVKRLRQASDLHFQQVKSWPLLMHMFQVSSAVRTVGSRKTFKGLRTSSPLEFEHSRHGNKMSSIQEKYAYLFHDVVFQTLPTGLWLPSASTSA